MRGRIARQIAGMQPCPRHDPHKVGHWRALEVCARRFWILFYVDVGDDHFAGRVHIISEQTGGVVLILLNDFIIASGSVQSFAPCGQLRNPDEHAALVKIGALFSEANLDRRTAAGMIAVPIRDGVAGPSSSDATVSSAQILSVSGEARVFAATCDK